MQLPSLEKIVADTLATIENSKNQIYEIAETARSESQRVNKELREIQQQVQFTIKKVDKLEVLEKKARLRLMEVSKNYMDYADEEVRQVYDRARQLQVELGSYRERENQLRLRRDELERSLHKLLITVDKAEGLVTQVGVALDYLGGNLKWINDELEVVNQRRQLAPRIIQAQEEERRRVAREIHDGPAQSLANVVLRTEVCEKMLDIDKNAARRELQELRATVKNSLQDVRRIIFALRPMALDDLGLIPAISRYLENVKKQHKLNIEMDFSEERWRLDSVSEVALFRIIQEAAQNAVKHAKADKIKVIIEENEQSILVSIRDDGVGFASEEVLKNPKPDSYGLLGMKERVEVLGGQLTIMSKPGRGTEISVHLPLEG